MDGAALEYDHVALIGAARARRSRRRFAVAAALSVAGWGLQQVSFADGESGFLTGVSQISLVRVVASERTQVIVVGVGVGTDGGTVKIDDKTRSADCPHPWEARCWHAEGRTATVSAEALRQDLATLGTLPMQAAQRPAAPGLGFYSVVVTRRGVPEYADAAPSSAQAQLVGRVMDALSRH